MSTPIELSRPVDLGPTIRAFWDTDTRPCAICRRPRATACTPCGIPHDSSAAERVLGVPRSPRACEGCLLQIGHELAHRPVRVASR